MKTEKKKNTSSTFSDRSGAANRKRASAGDSVVNNGDDLLNFVRLSILNILGPKLAQTAVTLMKPDELNLNIKLRASVHFILRSLSDHERAVNGKRASAYMPGNVTIC